MQAIVFKRGDTWLQECVANIEVSPGVFEPLDITDVTIASQVRNKDDLIGSCIVTKLAPYTDGKFQLLIADTSLWPISSVSKKLTSDIQYTIEGQKVSTETFEIDVVKDVTQP